MHLPKMFLMPLTFNSFSFEYSFKSWILLIPFSFNVFFFDLPIFGTSNRSSSSHNLLSFNRSFFNHGEFFGCSFNERTLCNSSFILFLNSLFDITFLLVYEMLLHRTPFTASKLLGLITATPRQNFACLAYLNVVSVRSSLYSPFGS